MSSHPRALLLRTDGSFELLASGARIDLNILYRALGCSNIAAVEITADLTMWRGDEAFCSGAPVNRPATLLYAAHREPHRLYHGHAVITGGHDRHGAVLGLTEDQLRALVENHLMTVDAEIPTQRTK
ncbi:DUF3846 domain-containing protein [Streptomyces sp. BE308]|uniref:DUF3846 domain-containing protein n=1 Tax=Streptomyces sp. BE308 TaxID=3002529 RepID=UPI002E76C5E9|nr:DUF3846 domain-containing protein [Streptomyces sp. BE308]MEE1789424.1 DUF3846 domain-containing protein [Streptomyces sp. BE308]